MKRSASVFSTILGGAFLLSCGALVIDGNPGYGGGTGTGTQLPETEMRLERITFRTGSERASVQGDIRGRQTVDYLLQARTGDYLNISMSTDNSSAFFDILRPGEMSEAVFTGSRSGRQLEGEASRSGDYRIRVYMVEYSASRGERANYQLQVIKRPGGNAGPSWGVGDDNFQASGQILCSQGDDRTRQCEFGVVRRSPGDADVTVFRTNGSRRIIYFQKGRAVGYDRSQADRGRLTATRKGDLYIIRIGSERYEIPEAVVYGG